MQKYACELCNYVYDPDLGDPEAGIKPGTDFKDLPAEWFCPACGQDKDEFKPAVSSRA